MKANREEGFTLIELMIVVSIIGILAAIGISHFVSFRIRGNNTSAEALCRNAAGSLSALNSDLACWGISAQGAALVAAPGGSGAGAVLLGTNAALPAATDGAPGAMVTGTNRFSAATSGVGFTVPNRCDMFISTEGANNATYQIIVENSSGNRAFGSEAEIIDVMYFVQNDLWNNSGAAIDCTPPAVTLGLDFDPTGADVGVAGGGSPTPNWHMIR